jgi:hypothetical protein
MIGDPGRTASPPSLEVGELVVVVLLDASSGPLADPRDDREEVE